MPEPTKTRPGDQPLPIAGQECVQDALIALIRERRDLGVQRYGSALMTHNGRDAGRDALEEALDLTVYLMQVRMEEADRSAETTGELCGHPGHPADPCQPCNLPLGHDWHRDTDGCSWPQPTPFADLPERLFSGAADAVQRRYEKELETRAKRWRPALEEVLSVASSMEIQLPKPPAISILGADGLLTVAIHPDGRVEFGAGITLDEGAKAFWDAVQKMATGGAP